MSSKITVEIADNNELRTVGLMCRSHLNKDSGMLFKFDRSEILSFWGVNTYIPLDVAFVSKDFRIASIEEIVPLYPKPVRSKINCQYAIEVNSGFFRNNNIDVGDYVNIDGTTISFTHNKGLKEEI